MNAEIDRAEFDNNGILLKCPHCESADPIEIDDIYTYEEYLPIFCCENLRDDVLNNLYSGVNLKNYLKDYDSNIRRTTISTDWKIDYKIEIKEIEFKQAKEFIGKYHRHNKAPVGWKFGFCAYNGEDLVAVVSVGRPVARAYNNKPILEVNRLCVNDQIEKWKVFNACSKLYSAAARKCKKMGYKKVITYIRADENGSSLRASNFKQEAFVRGRAYIRNGVKRDHEIIDKWRYAINI